MPPRLLTWAESISAVESLADMIPPAANVDAVLAISRTGIVPGTIIAERLQIPRLCTIEIRRFDREEPGRVPEVGIPPHDDGILGRRVLIVDDLWATGASARLAYDYAQPRSQQVQVAVLAFYREENQQPIDPHYFVHEISDWVIFPWELWRTS